MSGGAITTMRNTELRLSYTTFADNSALLDPRVISQIYSVPTPPPANVTSLALSVALSFGCGAGAGGAVCYVCSDICDSTPYFNGLFAVTAEGNEAEYGGALYIAASQVGG